MGGKTESCYLLTLETIRPIKKPIRPPMSSQTFLFLETQCCHCNISFINAHLPLVAISFFVWKKSPKKLQNNPKITGKMAVSDFHFYL